MRSKHIYVTVLLTSSCLKWMQLKKLRLKRQPFDNTRVYENGGSVDPVREISGRNFSDMNTPTVTVEPVTLQPAAVEAAWPSC